MSYVPLLNVHIAYLTGRMGAQMVSSYEYDRAILWDRLLNRTAQFDLLKQQYPELATQYQELETAVRSTHQRDRIFTDFSRDIFQVEADLRDIVKQIRAKEGFENFQGMPFSESEIQSHGSQGPIVSPINNYGKYAGLAIIIYTTSVDIIRLPHYNNDNCKMQHEKLKAALELRTRSMEEAEQTLMDVLKWLWYNVAEPVLKKLDILRWQFDGGKVSRSENLVFEHYKH